MNTSTDSTNSPGGLATGIEPTRVSLIQVTYLGDETPSLDAKNIFVYAGDEIIWHTLPNEQRAFKIKLPRDFPVDKTGENLAPFEQRESGPEGEPAPEISEPREAGGIVPAGSTGDLVLRSRRQQSLRIRIRLDALPDFYSYEVIRVTGGGMHRILAGGVIIRPGVRPIAVAVAELK